MLFEPFRRMVEDRTVEAIVAACATAQPAELYFGRGSTQTGVERTGALPAGTTEDAVLDVLHARTPGGAALATVFRQSCHPVWMRALEISADFPGVARAALEPTYGTTLFLQGFAGTCDPRSVPDTTMEAAMVVHGEQLARDVVAVLHPAGQTPLAGMARLAGRVAARSISIQHPFQGDAPALAQEVQALFIGSQRDDWCLVGCAHEVTTDHSARAQHMLPIDRVTLAGYCNDQRGYVASDALLARETYEAVGSNWYYGHVTSGRATDRLQTGIDARLLQGIRSATDFGWTAFGSASQVVAMAAAGQFLYCATGNNKLWRLPALRGDRPWEELGHADNVVGLAAVGAVLYCATSSGGLWWRPAAPGNLPWQACGRADGVVAMTAYEGNLYGATGAGGLWRRPATTSDAPIEPIGHATQIVGLATARGRLIAATSNGVLHWRWPTAQDEPWRPFAAGQVIALSSIGERLFCVTAAGSLQTKVV